MKQNIFLSVVLILIGVLIGLFILTSYQFHKRLQAVEGYIIESDKSLSGIENYINTNLIRPADSTKQQEGN